MAEEKCERCLYRPASNGTNCASCADALARTAKYEQELSEHEDLWGVVIGMIRGADYRAGSDQEYRAEVRAILDARENVIALRQLKA